MADNPLREALIARDPEMARAALADDVIVRSPIFSVEFDGVDEATEVLDAVFQTIGEIEYFYDERGEGEDALHVFCWRSDVDGEPIEGTDIVRYDAAGKVAELTVFMRPLRGIAAFLDKGGPIMAKNRSRGTRMLMRAAGPPPTAMMRVLAGTAPKMLGLKRARTKG